MTIGLHHYLVVGAVLFCLGLFGVVTRRNAIGVLLGIELILNGANINFVAFSRFGEFAVNGHQLDGQVFAIFVIVMAAAEAAVALAIVLNIYNNFQTINVDEADSLRL